MTAWPRPPERVREPECRGRQRDQAGQFVDQNTGLRLRANNLLEARERAAAWDPVVVALVGLPPVVELHFMRVSVERGENAIPLRRLQSPGEFKKRLPMATHRARVDARVQQLGHHIIVAVSDGGA